MSTATTTKSKTGQTSSRRTTIQPTNTATSQLDRSANNKLHTTMAAVRLAFTWLSDCKTLAPERRTTAARDFEQIQAAVGDLLVDRPHRNILRRSGVGGVE